MAPKAWNSCILSAPAAVGKHVSSQSTSLTSTRMPGRLCAKQSHCQTPMSASALMYLAHAFCRNGLAQSVGRLDCA